MRPTTDLSKLQQAACGRLSRIRRATSSLRALPDQEAGRLLAFGVLELDNLILSAFREFLISTLRSARTKTGLRIQTNRQFGPASEATAYILSVVSSVQFANIGSPTTIDRRQEAKIREPKSVEKVLIDCAATNLPSFQNALSLNTSLFRDIASVRNFYAHRNEDTWAKVRGQALNKGLLSVRHADELMNSYMANRPVTIFEDWLDDAELFFSVMTD